MQKSIIISHDNVFYYDNVKTDLPEIFKKVSRDINKRWKVDYYNIPVCFDFPVGHCDYNLPLIEGAEVSFVVTERGVEIGLKKHVCRD